MKKWWKLNAGRVSYRNKRIMVAVGLVICFGSIGFTNYMAHTLREKEQRDIELWAYTLEQSLFIGPTDPLRQRFMQTMSNMPWIVTDENLRVINENGIPGRILDNPTILRRKLTRLSRANGHIEIPTMDGTYYMFYGKSNLLIALYYFPYIQISIIAAFVMLSFVAFNMSKQNEQDRVWIGMAKETAHQLGTPTSSLLGWVEHLRERSTDQFVTDEMDKDLTRLQKIVDRFSKIGSSTTFAERNVAEMVENTVTYFRTRAPRNVEIVYNMPPQPEIAMINDALFEWVIENLLKNALDTLQGKGRILVTISGDDKWINIDVKDSGKGISKSNFQRIFEPGFTTKTRGWGLGLSLSRRIVEEYHKGRIYVLESEQDKGTTMRVSVRRVSKMF